MCEIAIRFVLYRIKSKITKKKLVGLLLLIILSTIGFAQGNYDFSPLNTLINSWINQHYYPGASVCIVKNNHIVFQKSYGNYTPDTKVYVASAGKWAAAAVAVVVDKTKLSWDDPVEK